MIQSNILADFLVFINFTHTRRS